MLISFQRIVSRYHKHKTVVQLSGLCTDVHLPPTSIAQQRQPKRDKETQPQPRFSLGQTVRPNQPK
jgi:hypothetical protein